MEKDTVKWTPMQAAAINARNKTLLVSAAAGSGKTAVLTERIITRLCDKDNPVDISRLLVVTFTRAAANELKARISKRITSAIADDPANKHLRKQLLLLTSAKISTIHSFCFDIIKRNIKSLGFSSAVKIASETEMLILSNEIMTNVIDDAYHGIFAKDDCSESFHILADVFSTRASDTALCKALIEIYNSVLNYPEGIEFFNNCSKQLLREADLPIYETTHGKMLIAEIASYADYLLREYKKFEKDVRADDIICDKYLPILSDEISYLGSIKDNIDNQQFHLILKILNAFKSTNLPAIRGYSTPLTAQYQALRKNLKEQVTNKLEALYSIDVKESNEQTLLTSKLLYTVYSLLYSYEEKFSEEKKRIGRLDYSDLERYALKLLYSDGEITDIAKEISDTFDEIYIDEYQDTNYVQDMIFTAVSKKDNRFMVGDIKQSIYGFRGAAPENFSYYRDTFPLYDEKNESAGAANTIFLSNNFRCDKSVIDFCNTIFSCIFRNATGRVTYYDSDNLECSKAGGMDDNVPVNIVLAGSDACIEGDYINEADYIANEIKRIITFEKKKDGSPYKASDIAVMTKAKASSVAIENAINKLGIQTSNDIETEFFENAEILFVMSLLNTIDNPMRDIYLAGTLRSPLFSFTLDDLVTIRAYKPNATLYESLSAYTDDTGFEKGKYFIDKLNYFRTVASGTQIDRLIKKIYRECDLFAIVASGLPAGATHETARQNLMLLYQYARDFEGSSFKGLSSFIKYVDDIIEQKGKIPVKSKPNDDNCVQLMTIHHSKGLEFPVVFVAACQKLPNIEDKSRNILFDRNALAAVNLPGPLIGMKKKTFHKSALELALEKNLYEETMRVIYVALTRAKERLYITGEYPNPEKEYDKVKDLSKSICPHTIMKRHSYMRFILIPVLAFEYEKDPMCNIILPKHADLTEYDDSNIGELILSDINKQDEITQEIIKQLDFRYPYSQALALPSKMSVSNLSENVLDTNVSLTDSEEALKDALDKIKPDFVSSLQKEESGAQKGVATHLFMQFCNFDSVENYGVEKEIERMLALNYFDARTAALIDKKSIADFFAGKLYLETIRKSAKLFREYRFNVELEASAFTKDPDKRKALESEMLFVQGIIDCFVENNDGSYTLIDYKTDHIPHDMKADHESFKALLSERHHRQLTYYKKALEIITKKQVRSVLIYSFALGCEIDITHMCNFEK